MVDYLKIIFFQKSKRVLAQHSTVSYFQNMLIYISHQKKMLTRQGYRTYQPLSFYTSTTITDLLTT
jgi:hypothetical protein